MNRLIETGDITQQSLERHPLSTRSIVHESDHYSHLMVFPVRVFLALVFSLVCSTIVIANDSALDPYNAYIKLYPQPSDPTQISIAIKDNIDVAGRVTSGGSIALKDNIAIRDAFLIKKLRDSGYHISGKTNLSEWANFRSNDSVSGWSSLGGQTLHPIGIDRNPCGSSSGSAVAVASGLVEVAIGTETNGSITCPASVTGVVGMKPTLGLVSRSGIIPISSSQDTAGPMGKDVETVARVLSVISGLDENDPSTKQIPDSMNLDFTDLDFRENLSDYRIGLLTSGLDDPDGARMLADLKVAIDTLNGNWVEPIDERVYPGEAEYFVLLYEFKVGLERYLASSKTKEKKLSELIDFNNRNKQIVMPHFEQDIFLAAEKAAKNPAKYQDSLIELKDTKKQTLAIFSDNQVDVLVGLTRGPAWEIDYAGGDSKAIKRAKRFGNGGYAAISGLPHITIPAYQIDGYPVGVSVIGRPWEDLLVLQVAAALETFFRARFPKS